MRISARSCRIEIVIMRRERSKVTIVIFINDPPALYLRTIVIDNDDLVWCW
jgi:hypothetical protein